jgi:hypothetical protein
MCVGYSQFVKAGIAFHGLFTGQLSAQQPIREPSVYKRYPTQLHVS